MSEVNNAVSTENTVNPFLKNQPQHLAAGSVTIESERAIGEVQAKLVIAKRFPRNLAMSFDKLMESCDRKEFAESAIYRYPRGGANVEGASIRLAEEIARCLGNIEYGLRELSNKTGESEMEAFAWDQEANVTSSQRFVVKHKRDTRGGATSLKDERDIYEVTANMGARRMRARILAIVPPEFEKAAIDRCKQTLTGNKDKPLIDRRNDMVQRFKKLSVTIPMLESYLDKKIDEVTEDDLIDLTGVYQAIKSGGYPKEQYFKTKDLKSASSLNDELNP